MVELFYLVLIPSLKDSTRDGVVFGDDLLDLGTDWDLLWTCMDWLMVYQFSAPPVSLPPCTPSIIGPESGKTGWNIPILLFQRILRRRVILLGGLGDNTTSDWIGPYNSGENVLRLIVGLKKVTIILK